MPSQISLAQTTHMWICSCFFFKIVYVSGAIDECNTALMCCYNTPGHAPVLAASSQEFPELKFLIKYRLQGRKRKASTWEFMDSKSAWGINFSRTCSWKYRVIVTWFHSSKSLDIGYLYWFTESGFFFWWPSSLCCFTTFYFYIFTCSSVSIAVLSDPKLQWRLT